ncbi:hypothetical protein NMY22_g19064 [Coprinellus aureogranulatus]|nr:hypothetical protein NMY22_g19064 [Coprinellus aureogranulatus]
MLPAGTSSSPPPPSPDRWAASTDRSYESSFLNPSPSALTLNLEDAPEESFETSILRPSGSPSSVNRLSTIPPSPLSMAEAPIGLPALSPVPPLSESAESEDAATPTTLSFTSTLSGSSPTSSLSSFISESASLLHDLEEQAEEAEEAMSEVRTVPTLLSTPSERALTLTPTPMRSPQLGTPSASVAVSVTTPHGEGSTDRSSLRTVDSESTVTERDLGRDMDELAAQLREYDHNRGLEHQDVQANLQALREELHDLAEFLHRTPPPPATIVVSRPAPPAPAQAIPPLPDALLLFLAMPPSASLSLLWQPCPDGRSQSRRHYRRQRSPPRSFVAQLPSIVQSKTISQLQVQPPFGARRSWAMSRIPFRSGESGLAFVGNDNSGSTTPSIYLR